MIWLAVITSAVLLVLALIHGLWAAEIWWPIRDERRLVAAVVGFQDATRMPGAIPCGLVSAFLLICVGLIWMPAGLLREIGLWAVVACFVIRGALSYWPGWRRLATQHPFARNDQLFYGPLCIALGLAQWSLIGWP